MDFALCFIHLCFMSALVYLTDGLTCMNSAGKSLCNARRCPKKLKCKGNIGKDRCNCCSVCLKQENEECGDSNHGKCDHYAPYCAKLKGESVAKCITLKTALLKNVQPYVNRVLRIICKDGEDEKKSLKIFYKCALGSAKFFCRKEPTFIPALNCCLKKNHCNPDPEVYELLDVLPVLQTGL